MICLEIAVTVTFLIPDIMGEEKRLKRFSFEEVQNHKKHSGANEANSYWIAIHDKVYDVTNWLNDHPGGEEILVEHAGQDATEDWEDIGHSTTAREKMKDYLIGELREEDRKGVADTGPPSWDIADSSQVDSNSTWSSWIMPVSIIIIATMLYMMYFAGE